MLPFCNSSTSKRESNKQSFACSPAPKKVGKANPHWNLKTGDSSLKAKKKLRGSLRGGEICYNIIKDNLH